ncbi:MAG: HEAT repeat domain-containing protein, partial [Candidatus Hydrogenedentes bacterium]|nr:HEAT repeat domain-containing protein [Candidatus Hydrogenedentota bacterium]
EAALIQVLQSDAGWPEKQEACRMLRRTGTEACIPALAALLSDGRLSHMARYALEPMPYAAATQALREALPQLQGMPKAGVAASLGVMRDAAAVPLIVPLLSDPDLNVAKAAAGALGRIGAQEAVQALSEAAKTAPAPLQAAVLEGLLAAGERMVAAGEQHEAASLYQELAAGEYPAQVRMGAWRGRAYAQPDQTSAWVFAALLGEEDIFRGLAAQVVAETTGEEVTRFYAEGLSRLPAAGQVALLRGLADRGDAVARPAVVKAMESADPEVRLAAVAALGALGNADNVPLLVDLLASSDAALSEAARVSLTVLRGDAADNAIAAVLPETAPEVRARLLALLAARRAAQTVPLAVAGLEDADLAVRVAALEVIADNGNADQAPAVVAVVLNASESDEQSAALKTLNRLASRYGDGVLPVVLGAMNGASAETRATLLGTVALVRGPKALETVLAALDDTDAQVVSKALNLLSNWPTLDAAPHLLELAKSEDASRYVLGLRGFVRLAQTEQALDKKMAMLAEAMQLAKRPDERKLLLGAWGSVPAAQSLDVLLPFLDDAAVRAEAAAAITAVAGELAKQDEAARRQAAQALKAVLEKCPETQIRDGAQAILNTLG